MEPSSSDGAAGSADTVVTGDEAERQRIDMMIRDMVRQRTTASRSAFIILHGSFNPVHRQHIDMMIRAKERLEEAGYDVVRGVMAMTSHEYLQRKTGGAAMKDRHRIAMLHLACSHLPWLTVNTSYPRFRSAHNMKWHLWAEFEQEAKAATIFEVVGADTIQRYGGDVRKDSIVIDRVGSDVSQSILASQSNATMNIFFVRLIGRGAVECSSTNVRNALQTGNAEMVRAICSQSVAEYLLRHSSDLY